MLVCLSPLTRPGSDLDDGERGVSSGRGGVRGWMVGEPARARRSGSEARERLQNRGAAALLTRRVED